MLERTPNRRSASFLLNFDLLKISSKGHSIGIFAASLKQIEAVDQNV